MKTWKLGATYAGKGFNGVRGDTVQKFVVLSLENDNNVRVLIVEGNLHRYQAGEIMLLGPGLLLYERAVEQR
jgi:hypothetical protein